MKWPRRLLPGRWMVVGLVVGILAANFLRDAPWWLYYPALLGLGFVLGYGISQHEEWKDLQWRRREQWTEDDL